MWRKTKGSIMDDKSYEAVTIQTLRIISMMREMSTDADIIQTQFLGEVGDYEIRLAKREGIKLKTSRKTHEWDECGERWLKCGDKDWFANKECGGKTLSKPSNNLCEEKILSTFKENGIKIELGARYSAKGQIAQLINSADELIEQCAVCLETQAKDSNYSWANGSFWGNMVNTFAGRIRNLKTIKEMTK